MASTAFAQSSAADASGAFLAPGDVVRIVVWGKPEFSGDFIVAPNGTITHPLLREITAAGVPIPELERRVRTFLAKYVADPAFVMSPLLHAFVGGEVHTPGNIVAPPGTTINQALVLAGGWTPESQLEHVLLIRNGIESTLNLKADAGREGAALVHSGDQILVGQTSHTFRDAVVPALTLLGFVTGIANLVAITTRR